MINHKKKALEEVTISGEHLLCGYYALAICIRYEGEIILNYVYEKLKLKKEDIAKINEEDDSKFQLSLGNKIKEYYENTLKSAREKELIEKFSLGRYTPEEQLKEADKLIASVLSVDNISLEQIRYIAKALIPNSEVLIDGQDRKCEYQSNYLKEFYNEPADSCEDVKINEAKQYILRDIFSSSPEEIKEGKFTFDPHNTNFNFEYEIKKFLEIDKIKEKIETDVGKKFEEVEFETLKAKLISISNELNKEILKEVNESKKVILYMANPEVGHYTALVVSQQQESTSEKSKENTIVLKSQQQELTSEKLQENTISKEKALPQTQFSQDNQSSSKALNTSLKIPSKERSVQASSSSIPISSSTMPTSSDSTKKTNHQLLLELIGNKDSSLMQIYSLIREVYKNDELGKINDDGKSLIHIAVEAGNYNVIPAISAMGSKYLNQRIGEILSDKKEDKKVKEEDEAVAESEGQSSDQVKTNLENQPEKQAEDQAEDHVEDEAEKQAEDQVEDQVKINYEDKPNYGLAPLHLAIRKDYKPEDLKSVKLLLMGKADVNIKTIKTQSTPIHRAVRYSVIEVVKTILNYGADINVENKHGKTAINIWQEDSEIKELLNQHLKKAKPSSSPTSPSTSSTSHSNSSLNNERSPS